MKNKCKAVFKYALALVFLCASTPAAAAGPVSGNPELCKNGVADANAKVKKCNEDSAAAKAAGGAVGGGAESAGGSMFAAGTNAAALNTTAATSCNAVYQACKEPCVGQAQLRQCESFKTLADAHTAGATEATAAADQGAATQSAAGGSGSSMMPMLMGAAMGGLMGYMLAQQLKKKDEEKEKDDDGALLPSGQVDCSKEDAYMYGQCNVWLETNCINNLDAGNCKKFALRYCGTNSSQQNASGGFVGEGIGTPFCSKNLAWGYCKVQGREQCPSCLGLQRAASPACAQDPSLCLAQNTPEQINQAKTTCPTDPAFSNPAFTAGGGSQVPAQLQPGAPVVVLPQSVGDASAVVREGSASGVATSSSASGTSSSGISTQSAANGAIKEGQPNGAASSASYAGGGDTAGGGYGAGGAAGARDVASTQRAAGGNYRTASAGPAPDVEGPFGPSLFKTSTAVIKSRCDAGKLNNCP